MLDLNDVALFVHVVRYGSFAQAARLLGMPANTLSRRVQQLEDQVGTRLLQRSTRKLTLTQAGQAFHDRCSSAVEGLMEAGQQLISGSQEPSGTVRVAAMADFFDFFPMQWVADFLAAYPKVRLDFVLSDARCDLIAERIDIAFRGGILQDSGYVGRQLLEARHDQMVASPAYLDRHGIPATLEALAGHDAVSFTQPGHLTTWRLKGPDNAEHDVRIASRFIGNTAQALRKATLAGLGITLLPITIVAPDLHAGRLVPVLPDYYRTGYGLHVLYPSRQHLPLAVSAFIELVMERLGRQGFTARD
ncbi:LysR family transcriptional regulator [Pseudomonas syringae]|nr:LysR family transcriptional regulator [Pseudomonas syringae]